jgi:F-type H+-transporting ATPase subunit O
LVDKKKLNSLGSVISRFDDISSYMRGEVKVKVTTARDMNQKLQGEIESSLKQLLKPGQTLLVEKNVDPSIIGGVVIEVQDQNVDGSVANRVKQLQKLATEART